MRAVNLIPAEQRGGSASGGGRSQGAAYAVVAVLAGLALFLFLYGRADHQISSDNARAAQLTAQAAAAQAKAGQLAPYASFIALREQREQAVAELAGTRFNWAHVLHEFGRVLPRGTSISALSGTVGSASSATSSSSSSKASAGAVASSTPAGSVPSFTLSGCATSQREVALALERLRLIDGVSEVTLASSTVGTATGAAASAASGGCPAKAAQFSVTVNFQPLPTPASTAGSPASAPSTATAAATSGATP